MPMNEQEAADHEELKAKVEDHGTILAKLSQDVANLVSDAEEGVKSELLDGIAQLDDALRREGLSLLQVLSTTVRNITGHDIRLEQTSNVPKL